MSDRILDPETEVLQALSQAINEATFHNAYTAHGTVTREESKTEELKKSAS